MSIYGALGMPGGRNKEGAVARGRAVNCVCARDSQRGGYRLPSSSVDRASGTEIEA